jgi:hypothetical protein
VDSRAGQVTGQVLQVPNYLVGAAACDQMARDAASYREAGRWLKGYDKYMGAIGTIAALHEAYAKGTAAPGGLTDSINAAGAAQNLAMIVIDQRMCSAAAHVCAPWLVGRSLGEAINIVYQDLAPTESTRGANARTLQDAWTDEVHAWWSSLTFGDARTQLDSIRHLSEEGMRRRIEALKQIESKRQVLLNQWDTDANRTSSDLQRCEAQAGQKAQFAADGFLSRILANQRQALDAASSSVERDRRNFAENPLDTGGAGLGTSAVAGACGVTGTCGAQPPRPASGSACPSLPQCRAVASRAKSFLDSVSSKVGTNSGAQRSASAVACQQMVGAEANRICAEEFAAAGYPKCAAESDAIHRNMLASARQTWRAGQSIAAVPSTWARECGW